MIDGLFKRTCAAVVLAFLGGSCMSHQGELGRRALAAEQANEPAKLEQAGDASASVGDFTRAEQYYNLAVQAGGDEARIVQRLIRVCVDDQRYRDAIQYAENHVRRYPQDHAVRFLLASLELGVGEPQRGERELERLLAALPNHADAHYALAVVLRDDIGNLGGADEHFRAYLRLEPRGTHADEARGSLLESVEQAE